MEIEGDQFELDKSFLDPVTQDDPFEAYDELRQHCPVYKLPETGLFMVTRYEDVREVLTTSSVFSSRPGAGAGGANEASKAHAAVFSEKGWVKARTLQRTDPPEHTQYRKILGRVFTNRTVERMRPRLEEITNQLKEAMNNKNTNLVNTLRLIKASIKDKDIIAKGNGKGDISDQEIISVLQTMIKQRKASIDMYLSGNREDLVKKEENEIEIISNFLPQQLSLQEIDIIINDMIISSGASSIKNIGGVIKLIKEKYDGRIDLGVASKLIKEKLSEI